jgi:ABC-type sugar transport system ATPase subunit/ribose/xylose/arabinose/galactoside ABC-type transport system permease subunit
VFENVGLQQGLPANRLGIVDWPALRRRTRAALAAVGDPVSPSSLAGSLTPAQRQLVEIAAAVSVSARALVLDEPTSSLSDAEANVLFEHLRNFRARGAAILYVSHRFEDIFALADEVTVLRDGQRVWTGPIKETSGPALIRHMVGREVVAAPPRLDRAPGPVRLRCRGVSAADGSFTDVTLEVRAGEVLGLYGLVGAGRTEWAQGLFGLRPLAGGDVQIDGRPVKPHRPGQMAREGVAYVPEDRLRQGVCPNLAVRANAVLASLRGLAFWGWLARSAEVRQAQKIVEQLAIRCRSLEQPVGTLSGGNQQKVVLGRWLGREPAVLVLDEPTRGVDVGAREEIYALVRRLSAAGRAVVFISSDLPEVVTVSDRVGVFRTGRLVGTLDPRLVTPEEIAASAMPVERADRATATAPPARRPRALRELALLVVVAVFFGVLHALTGDFLSPSGVRSLLTDAALLGFCAIGAALVLLAGGLDISLGALMALSGAVAGKLWADGAALPVVFAAAIAVGAVGGALNAALSLVGRVHPIVVTLGTMSVYRGLTLWWLGENVLIGGSERNWALVRLLGLPLVAWLGLLTLGLAWAALNHTVWGREAYAFGSNPAAAHRVSIERGHVWLRMFTLQGALAGLAGLLYLARSGGLQPTSYEEKTLESIAAAVVGGVAITGGRGSVWGVALGCLFLVSLGPACTALELAATWRQALVGSVMVVAVLIDALWRGRAP